MLIVPKLTLVLVLKLSLESWNIENSVSLLQNV